jgi:hypothetical protein
MVAVIAGVTALAWKTSADREVRSRMPDPDRVFPSRREFAVTLLPKERRKREKEREREAKADPELEFSDWSKQIIEFERAKKEEGQSQDSR